MNRAHVLKRCGVIDVAEREGEERITEQSIYMSMAQVFYTSSFVHS